MKSGTFGMKQRDQQCTPSFDPKSEAMVFSDCRYLNAIASGFGSNENSLATIESDDYAAACIASRSAFDRNVESFCSTTRGLSPF